MTSVFSILLILFACLFWVSRVVIAICYTLGTNIGIVPVNYTLEIILLFVSLFCLVLVIKRNIFGALVYFLAYGIYFGDDLYNKILFIQSGYVSKVNYLPLIIPILGILIPFLIVLDIFINKEGKGKETDKKTDWFYTNKDFDRKHDERADLNQYKF